ncbi:MAG: UvrB/UvrC motif-containing protein [Clostridiales bacterium]|nr:UvrB/UvrC motif-containing protein [Clostridiales bacterium]
MLCQKCNHNNATVHYEQNINGKVTKLDLCPECAKEMNIGMPQFSTGFSSLLDGFGSLFGEMPSISSFFDTPSQIASTSCTGCNTSLGELNNSSFLGCPDCYSAFESLIENTLGRCQKDIRHTGKRPNRLGGRSKTEENTGAADSGKPMTEVEKLRAELKEAVKAENYEKAAELRDKIKELEQ